MTDYYGNSLKVGTVVAFNYQGQVRRGTIVTVYSVTRYGKPTTIFEVRHWLDSQVSKITNKNNLMWIDR
jgi:hypothetical protein